MQEFNLESFVANLKDLFINNPSMPKSTLYYMNKYGQLQLDSDKHPNREPLHLQDAIKNSFDETTSYNENIVTFDLGNERMETMHPYYHILENTPYIRKRDRGTTKTKGSQANVVDIAKRDYEIVRWNGKTFSKEYSRNVRGRRNRDENATMRYGNVLVQRNGNTYKNEHYQYIERILDSVCPLLAQMFNCKLMRTQKTGLEEDLAIERGVSVDTILDIFQSFE